MINPRSGLPMYAQLADTLRAGILSGRFAPGQPLPSERTLMEEHGLGRHTVRRAVAMLRTEGLVTFVKGLGLIVRESPDLQELTLSPGAEVRVRMPTAAEREEFGLEDGTPVFAVTEPGGPERVLPGDRWMLRMPRA